MEPRLAHPLDLPYVLPLLQAYARERFERGWLGTEEELARDLQRGALALWIAGRRPIGFAAVVCAYDLPHCASGAEVIDLFVARPHRGLGVAAALLCAIAADTMRDGGVFVRGAAVPDPVAQRLYLRVGLLVPSGHVIAGGRAFRQLAALAGRSPRAILGGLPEPRWNHE